MFVFFFKFEVERKVNMYFLLKINMIAINSFFFFAAFHWFPFLKDSVLQEMHLLLGNT